MYMKIRSGIVHHMNILALILGALAQVAGPAPVAPPVRPPNVVVILVDDMGFQDLSFTGNRVIETPRLDQLARESVFFQQHYVQSVCATTRAQLLTGRHFLKVGVSGVHGGREFLKLGEPTIADTLRRSNYATGMWGKWHSGKSDGYFPWHRGFDEAFMAKLYWHDRPWGLLNGKPVRKDGWADDVCTDYAIDFMTRNRDRPFFAYLPYQAPHEPWLARDALVQKYVAKGLTPRLATYAGMMEQLDANVGRLLDAIDALRLAQDTVVIFMSDNGAWLECSRLGRMDDAEWALRNPGGLRGNKGTNWENGVRSPMFVRWKGTFAPGVRYQLTSIEDLFPTIAGLTRTPVDAAAIDGLDLSPLLRENLADWSHKPVYIAQWNPELPEALRNVKEDPNTHHIALTPEVKRAIRFEDQRLCIRTDRYKLVLNQSGGTSTDGREIYDVRQDPREERNLAANQPERVREMTESLRAWYESILANPDAYTSPTFQIGWPGSARSDVLGVGACATRGQTVKKAHFLAKLGRTGDGANFHVNFVEAGTYDVRVIHESLADAKVSLRLRCGQEVVELLVDAADPVIDEEVLLEGGTLHESAPRPIRLVAGLHTLSLDVASATHSAEPAIGKVFSIRLTRSPNGRE